MSVLPHFQCTKIGKHTRLAMHDEATMSILSAGYSADGTCYAAATAKGTVYVMDTTPHESFSTTGHGHAWAFNPGGLSDAAAVSCVRFSAEDVGESRYLAITTLTTGAVSTWIIDPEAKKAVPMATAYERGNETMAAAITQDGTRLVTAGSDKTIRLYNHSREAATEDNPQGGTLELVREYVQEIDMHGQVTLGPNSRIFTTRFFGEGEQKFMTGGWESPVLLYDARTKGLPYGALHGPHISGDALDVDGHIVVAGSDRQADQLQFFDLRKVRTGVPAAPSGQEDPSLFAQQTTPGRVFTVRHAKSRDPKQQKVLRDHCVVWAGMVDPNSIACVAGVLPGGGKEETDPFLATCEMDEAVFCLDQNPGLWEYMTVAGAKAYCQHVAASEAKGGN